MSGPEKNKKITPPPQEKRLTDTLARVGYFQNGVNSQGLDEKIKRQYLDILLNGWILQEDDLPQSPHFK